MNDYRLKDLENERFAIFALTKRCQRILSEKMPKGTETIGWSIADHNNFKNKYYEAGLAFCPQGPGWAVMAKTKQQLIENLRWSGLAQYAEVSAEKENSGEVSPTDQKTAAEPATRKELVEKESDNKNPTRRGTQLKYSRGDKKYNRIAAALVELLRESGWKSDAAVYSELSGRYSVTRGKLAKAEGFSETLLKTIVAAGKKDLATRKYTQEAQEDLLAKRVAKHDGSEYSGERLVKKPEVAAITGLSESSIYKLMSKKLFPRPVHLGVGGVDGNAVAWVESELIEWVRQRISKRKTAYSSKSHNPMMENYRGSG